MRLGAAAAVTLAMAAGGFDGARADGPTPFACPDQATAKASLDAAVATGGSYAFSADCSILLSTPYALPQGRTLSLDAAGHNVSFLGCGGCGYDVPDRSFMTVSGTLTLKGIKLSNFSRGGLQGFATGVKGTAGTNGADGSGGAGGPGTDGLAQSGGAMTIAATGNVTLDHVALDANSANGGLGGPGGTGGSGAPGSGTGGNGGAAGLNGRGGDARGGAISNAGRLSIISSAFTSNAAIGGEIVSSAEGGAGGQTGHGVGGDGGAASPGSKGGDALGGAIYNTGTLAIADTTFSSNKAQAGRARGGDGGAGGPATFADGHGGNGADGGAAGLISSAVGGAVYSTVPFTVTGGTTTGNEVTGGTGYSGAGGLGGLVAGTFGGPNGGQSGRSPNVSNPGIHTDPDYHPAPAQSQLPEAAFTWKGTGRSCLGLDSCEAGANSVDLVFDGSNSTAIAGRRIARWDWDFGDGTTAQGAQVSHTFAERRPYDVTLKVTDDANAEASVTRTVDQCRSADAPQATSNFAASTADLATPPGGSADPFSCYRLTVGDVSVPEYPNAAVSGNRYDLTTVERAVSISGSSWTPARPHIEFRDASCPVDATTCGAGQTIGSQPNAANDGWTTSVRIQNWPAHSSDSAKACRGYVLATQAFDGKLLRRVIQVRATIAGRVVFASGSKIWRAGDLYCEGEDPAKHGTSGEVLVTRRLLDRVQTPDEQRLLIGPPPGTAQLNIWNGPEHVDLGHAQVALNEGSTLCLPILAPSAPYGRGVVVHYGAGNVTATSLTGVCPRQTRERDDRIAAYGHNAVARTDFLVTRSCFLVTEGLLAQPPGGNLYLHVPGEGRLTCSDRLPASGPPQGVPYRQRDGSTLFVQGSLRLRMPLGGSWRLIADGSLQVDRAVSFGTAGGFDVPAVVAGGDIQLGGGPVPHGITSAEKAELVALAQPLEKRSRDETVIYGPGVSVASKLGAATTAGLSLAISLIFPESRVALKVVAVGGSVFSTTAAGVAEVITWDGRSITLYAEALRRAAGSPTSDPDESSPFGARSSATAYLTVPKPHVVRPLPKVRPGRLISRLAARALTAVLGNRGRVGAYAEAFSRASERGDDATRANNVKAARAQNLAAASYAGVLAKEVLAGIALRHRLAAALRSGLLAKASLTAKGVKRLQAFVRRQGLPAASRRLLARLGYDAAQIAQIRAQLLQARPAGMPRLLSLLTSRTFDAPDRRAAALLRTVAARLKASPAAPVP